VTLGLVEVLINICLTWILVGPFGIFGIALATSISLTITAIVTTVMITRELEFRVVPALIEPFIKISLMTAVMLVFAASTGNLLFVTFRPEGVFWANAALLAGIVPGAIAFLVTGILLRLGEIRSALGLLEQKWNLRPGRLFGG